MTEANPLVTVLILVAGVLLVAVIILGTALFDDETCVQYEYTSADSYECVEYLGD